MTEIEPEISSMMISKDLAKGHSSRERKKQSMVCSILTGEPVYFSSSLHDGMANSV